MAETSTSKRAFNMHPALLLSVIKKQAGSLDKAVLEGIMNSIDAGATRVDITLDSLKVTINDNGRGFQGATEIEEFFATFGTPHEEGDAVYGRFRMGRGQMFAFGKNLWRTGEFQMSVDVDTHIGYELVDNLENHNGCSIEIKLYEPLSQTDVAYMERSIAKMVKYSPVSIYLNGNKINVEIDLKKFPQTTEDAYINTDGKSGGLDIYNLGVYVCTLSAWQYGVSGVVVSRKQLDVNFARNQVLGTCKVWKNIRPIVDYNGKQKVTKTATILTDAEQGNVIARLVSGDMHTHYAEKIRFIKDSTGKVWSPKLIRSKNFEYFSVANEGDMFADKVMQTGRAFVISRECLELFECEASELFKKFYWSGMPAFCELDKLTSGMNQIGEQLDKKLWKKSEIAWLKVAKRMMTACHEWHLDENRQYVSTYPVRNVTVGTSHVALAWTNGSTFVTFAREYLATLKMFKNGVPNIKDYINFATVLLHECCHDTDSRENVHSPDFYREFHDRALNGHLGKMVADATAYMTQAQYKRITGEFDLDSDDSETETNYELVASVSENSS